jgi:hypothetical protein
MNRKYRIVQRGNNRFYAQEKRFFFFWRDASWSSPSLFQTGPMNDIERRIDEDNRILNFKTIKKVIPV